MSSRRSRNHLASSDAFEPGLALKTVSETWDCHYELRVSWIVFDFMAQPKNVNVYGTRERRLSVSPNVLQQGAPRNRFAPILYEITKQTRLAFRKFDPGSISDQCGLTKIHPPSTKL